MFKNKTFLSHRKNKIYFFNVKDEHSSQELKNLVLSFSILLSLGIK